MSPRMVACGLAIAAAMLVVTGCAARQSDEQYREQLERALVVRDEVIVQVDRRSIGDRAAHLAVAKQLDAAAERLDVDRPPRSVEDAHDLMVSGMHQLARVVRQLGECARVEGAGGAARCRQQIGQEAFDRVRDDFAQANAIYGQNGFPTRAGQDAGATSDGVATGGDEL